MKPPTREAHYALDDPIAKPPATAQCMSSLDYRFACKFQFFYDFRINFSRFFEEMQRGMNANVAQCKKKGGHVMAAALTSLNG